MKDKGTVFPFDDLEDVDDININTEDTLKPLTDILTRLCETLEHIDMTLSKGVR